MFRALAPWIECHRETLLLRRFTERYRNLQSIARSRQPASFPLPPSSSSVAIEPRVYIYTRVLGIFVAKFLSFLKPNVSIVIAIRFHYEYRRSTCCLFQILLISVESGFACILFIAEIGQIRVPSRTHVRSLAAEIET